MYPFRDEQLFCILDYETFSHADIRDVGAFEYSVHPTTEVMCVAWRVGTKSELREASVRAWSPYLTGSDSDELLKELCGILADERYILVAHNAFFEQCITANVLCIPTHPSRWVCIAALVAALSVPRNLAQASVVLKLPIPKDTDGHKLMLKMSKPRKPTKNNPAVRHLDPGDVERLVAYCRTDVEAETVLFVKCPPLTPMERRVWILDQEINLRGFLVDRPLVCSALRMLKEETERLTQEITAETGGLITSGNQREQILAWLRTKGLFLPNLQKGTVEDALSSGLATGTAATMLKLRQASSKTSTAKYVAFEQRSRYDGRLRDILQYHTASTGRWGGSGVQPQNFPRGDIKDSIGASEVMAYGDIELVRMIYGEPMSVFSSCLRNMIIAPPGRVFDVADYASIEARVLFWVADHAEGVEAFRQNRPMYEEMAASIFGVPVSTIAKDSFERFVGKEAVLGMGYMMGWERFQVAIRGKGRDISDELAQLAVATYRERNWPVVTLWSNLERAAIAAVDNVGKMYTINHTSWFVKGSILWCKLPSGRCLAYPQPTVEWVKPPWGGEPKRTLCHWGVNSLTRKWEKQKTYGGKLTENVVQAISRDLMAEAMLRIDATGIWDIVLSVHDELAAERDAHSKATVHSFVELMEVLPDWAAGCPVKAEGWSGTRYKK